MKTLKTTVWQAIKRPKFYLKGISTYLPSTLQSLFPNHQAQFTGHGQRPYTDTMDIARAYYSVWMRLLVYMHEKGIKGPFPTVGEIGPGDSMATGLAALLSGSSRYIGLDVVPTAVNFNNEEILDALVVLFRTRASIPDDAEQPKQRPRLASYEFPKHILPDAMSEKLLTDERIAHIRQAIRNVQYGERGDSGEIEIGYEVPWFSQQSVKRRSESLDLIFSNAAMEHVDSVEQTYATAAMILKPGGVLVSGIDYKCHDTAGLWNGHWTYSNLEWKLIRGRSVYFINRWSHSMHTRELEKQFYIVDQVSFTLRNQLTRKDLASDFRNLSEKDLETSEGVILAKKR